MDRWSAMSSQGIFLAAIFLLFLVGVIYLINRTIRSRMKRTGDDVRLEDKLDGGDTIHAEGVLGGSHPDEGGIPVRALRRRTEEERLLEEERLAMDEEKRKEVRRPTI